MGSFNLDLPAETVSRLGEYYSLLTRWNDRLHLVAPCEPAEFAVRHVLESLLLLSHLPQHATIADIGSGGGLPIIPCLIAREDLEAMEERETTNDAKVMKTDAGESSSSAKERSNAFLLARLTYKKNPFRSSARPAPRGEQLQGELSLDKVKVVRNDLSDSDLELVESGRPAKTVSAKSNVFAAPTPGAEVKRPSWFARLVSKVARARIQ